MTKNSSQTIYFTGFMASGKSRVGRAVAEKLGRTFVDTDALIAERAGKTVSDIFVQDGEAVFRKMERDAIAEIAADTNPRVVALGGGTLTQPENLALIRKTGILVRLWATPETLSERIGRKNTRPLMTGLSPEERLEKIRTMLAEREMYYSCADFSVESSNAYSEDRVVFRVLSILKFWESHAVQVTTSSGETYPIFIGQNLIPNIEVRLIHYREAGRKREKLY